MRGDVCARAPRANTPSHYHFFNATREVETGSTAMPQLIIGAFALLLLSVGVMEVTHFYFGWPENSIIAEFFSGK